MISRFSTCTRAALHCDRILFTTYLRDTICIYDFSDEQRRPWMELLA